MTSPSDFYGMPIDQWTAYGLQNRKGDWMQTNSGRRFYPLDARPDDITPFDIAHALSLLCRYGGHIDSFYSVAEHCVLISQALLIEHPLNPEIALAGLLHDATEAYVVDVPRPIKRYLPEYREIEEGVWKAIARRFNISDITPAAVHDADNRILLTEKAALFARSEPEWPGLVGLAPLPVTIKAWGPARARIEYADALANLTALVRQ